FASLPFDQEWLYGMSLLAETAAALGEAGAAAALDRLLAPWSALVVCDAAEGLRGSLARYLGLLATTLERWTEAEERFAAALRTNGAMGLQPWLARTQEDDARMLRLRNEGDDVERAAELSAAALATFERLGMAVAAPA